MKSPTGWGLTLATISARGEHHGVVFGQVWKILVEDQIEGYMRVNQRLLHQDGADLCPYETHFVNAG
ncbi:MAG: hypothetical protein ACLQVG_11025 [Terriglobia bacterium]